jgi:hypothetical protein
MIAIYGHKWTSHLGDAVQEDGRLTDTARMWQTGLFGVGVEQIKLGLFRMIDKGMDWPPTLPQFRALCVRPAGNVPSLDDCVAWLSASFSLEGSLIERYKHPLVLAMAKHFAHDGYILRTASAAVFSKRIKPVYDAFILSGWEDWPSHAGDVPVKLAKDKAGNAELARSALASVRAVLRG